MFAAGAAGLLAGCSDATRFSDPLSDPFQDQGPRVDRAPTATIPPRTYAEAAPRSVIQSRPLPPLQAVAQAERYAPPAPSAPAPVARVAGSYNHWSAEGGTPVVVSDGETAGVVATRYGVPVDALLRVNGYARPADVHPGSRLVIPVYRAGAASPAAVEPHEPARVAADLRDRAAKGARREVETASERSRTPIAEARAEKRAPVAEPRVEKAKPAIVEAKVERTKAQPVAAKVEKPKSQATDARADKAKPQIARVEVEKPAPAKPAKEAAPAKSAAAHAEPARKGPQEAARKTAAAPAEPARKDHPAAPKEIAKAEPHKTEPRKVEPKARELAKKEPDPAPEPKRQTAATEKVEKREKKIAVLPAPAAPAQRIDKTPVASLPPSQPQEEKPAAAATAAADAAHPEFRWPARGRIIQGFASGGNDGINISVPEGTQVKAAEGGVVAYAGNELKGYGNLVLIRHPNGFVSAYAHNGEIEVKRGDQVKRGQNIAKSGQSGNVGSPQLHFELRKGATPVDPTGYLAGL
jgi:murein DD-endopeptidase MepM/ murein hydrolase activator NlpD